MDVPSLSKSIGATYAQNASAIPTGSRRVKIVELARNGRTLKELAEEFEPTQATTSGWLKQADRDKGARSDGPTTEEKEEIRQLRKKLRALQQERDILAKATAQSQEGERRCTAEIFRFIDLCQAEFPIAAMRECSWCLQERLLQVAEPTSLQTVPTGRNADHENQRNTWADRDALTGPVGFTRSFGPKASVSAKSAWLSS